ncbi:TPA: hypothetical protein ACHUUZ_000045 [Shigella dysenteriae]
MTPPIKKEQAEAVFDLRAGYQLGNTDIDILCKLAEYALAAMDAEPVAWVCAHGDEIEYNGHNQFSGGRQGLPLYAAPPAPVSVPDEMEPTVEAIKRVLPTSNPDEYAACIGADMWNACRAAMLLGAEPVSDELPEIECDICGFKSTDPDGAHYCCEDNSDD